MNGPTHSQGTTGVALGFGGPGVVVHTPSGSSVRLRPARRDSGKKLKWWIVRGTVLATTVFALLDLILLTSGLHH